MTLSAFIRANLEEILQEWENFAGTLAPLKDADKRELRDHAAAVLKVIETDLETPQGEKESIAKSHGEGPQEGSGDTAAEVHATHRVASGFNSEQVMAEFRALRSSVLRLWAQRTEITSPADIQDMIRFNEAIDQAQTESMTRYAKMLHASQNLFLAILGHDVRTPLGAISMGAQVLLQDQSLPAKALKVGLRIHNSAQRMDAIIKDLLDFSSSHLGDGIPVYPQWVDLAVVCRHLVEEARTFHPDREVVFAVEGDVSGMFDSARVAQAFANLISNAIQHGQPDIPVTVTLSGTQGDIRFEVVNQADVIDPSTLQHLFDPAQRFAIRAASARDAGALHHLGLGLYVVKEIVTAHHGKVDVRSSQDEGVTFTLLLPRHQPQRRAEDK